MELYEKSILLNVPQSMYNLALIYKSGMVEHGIRPNIHRTIELYEKAVKLGHVKSIHNLASKKKRD
jgi:TPR repeat protein